MKNVRLMVKLIGGFGVVALIVLVVGWVGLSGATQLDKGLSVLDTSSMPAVQKALLVEIAIHMIDSDENGLMEMNLTPQERQALYADIDAAKKALDQARQGFAALPVSIEAKAEWGRTSTALDSWWTAHTAFMAAARQYEQTPSDSGYQAMNISMK